MNKTQDEIVARINNRKGSDLFGFETSQYIDYLDFEHAIVFLKEGTTRRQWRKAFKDTKPPVEAIKDYMPFAWEKANDCRGISAGRSIMHMIAWLWLDGKDWPEIIDYKYYGKPQLVRICKEYSIDWKALDDGKWRNSEDGPSVTAGVALGTA